jgi:hypothetical protein
MLPSPPLAHHVNIAGEAICPELDEKRKCFARTHIKAAAPTATAPRGFAIFAAMSRLAAEPFHKRKMNGLF